MDFTVDQATLNYIDPVPPKLDALEEYREDRFAIPQLKSLLNEFEMATQSTGPLMQVCELASLLFAKLRNSVHFGGYDTAMPACWNDLGLPDVVQILRNLDKANTGFVDWRVLFTCLALQRSQIPKTVSWAGVTAENGFAEEAAFVGHQCWFDECETSKDRDYSHVFERTKMLHELLFRANCCTVEGGRRVINLDEFARKVQSLGAAGSSLHSVLFAKV